MKNIVCSLRTMKHIKESLRVNRKIAAIKALRNEVNCGLAEAKRAIERMEHEMGLKDYPESIRLGQKVIAGPLIKRLIVDYGEGEIEIDLETMELKALMKLDAIGLDSCADMLDLVSILKDYSEGLPFRRDGHQ